MSVVISYFILFLLSSSHYASASLTSSSLYTSSTSALSSPFSLSLSISSISFLLYTSFIILNAFTDLRAGATTLTYKILPSEKTCFYTFAEKEGEKIAFYFAVSFYSLLNINFQIDWKKKKKKKEDKTNQITSTIQVLVCSQMKYEI